MNSADRIREQLDALAGVDPDVAQAVRVVGYPPPRVRPGGFEALLAIIVSQQLSTHAAASIQRKLHALMDEVSPQNLIVLSFETLRGVGLSMRKVEYAQGLAQAMIDGDFDPAALPGMTDDEVVTQLTALRGFGRWSAEIHLMFSLQREDVFPADDLALRMALQKLKNSPERLNAAQARELVAPWSPWRSVGSLFLWHYYKGAPV